VLELLLAPLALPLLNARHRFRRRASRSRASARRRSTLGPSAPSSFAARPSRRLGPGPTVDGVLKSFQGGFESREPPLQAFDTRCGAADIGRLEEAQSDQAPGVLVPAHDAAEPRSPYPSSTSFGRPTRQVEEADLRCGPDRGRRARRITSPGLQQAYSSGTTTARASLARVSARRRSRARFSSWATAITTRVERCEPPGARTARG
jgi:hypothetical protein